MIEVVFGDSTFGSMKMAKNYKSDAWVTATPAYMGKKPTEAELKKLYDGQALGGKSSDVIGINFTLDIGSLAGGIESDQRKAIIREISSGPVGFIEDPEEAFRSYWVRAIDQLNLLKEKAKQGKSFRIWYSDTPYELCGYYFVCWLLHQYECQVVAIKLPSYIGNEDNTITFYKSWGEVQPGKFYIFANDEKSIPPSLLKINAIYWKELKEEDACLRASINGELKSVPQDFYDHFIKRNIPTVPTRMGKIIGNIMGHECLNITDFWIRKRIRHMISSGDITIVKGGENEYTFHIKKT